MDGSQKLPQRMLDSVRWHLVHQKPFPLLALGVAGWMRYVGGVDEQGNPIEASDPQLAVIRAAVNGSAEGESRVNALLGIEAILVTSCRRTRCLWRRSCRLIRRCCKKARRPRSPSTPPRL
ncbi:mannitol dehydrogenase family protein [Enterobacter hormaechei]